MPPSDAVNPLPRPSNPDVYMAVAPCGCAHGIETETGREAAAQVAKWIRRGSTVKSVPLSEAKARMVFDCPHTPMWGRTRAAA